jgi:acetylglutamate/LysW-gamma-L-alpha-aminoadipate kinase
MPLADEAGRAMNSENDDVVTLLQSVLGSELVVELVEAPGMLRDPGDPASVAARLDPDDLQAWESRAAGRFKRKLLAFRRMFEGRSPTVVVADGRTAHPIADAINGVGTVISRRPASEGAV